MGMSRLEDVTLLCYSSLPATCAVPWALHVCCVVTHVDALVTTETGHKPSPLLQWPAGVCGCDVFWGAPRSDCGTCGRLLQCSKSRLVVVRGQAAVTAAVSVLHMLCA